MAEERLDLIIQAVDRATGTLSGIGKSLSGLGSIARNALSFAAGGLLTKGLDLIGEGIGGIKAAMIDGNAEFERYQTQFGVLLGSTDAAKKRLEELAKFGAETPFELPEVVRADKILQAFGLHSEEAAKKFGFAGGDIRTIAGDVAAGTGASFEEISSYLGKFSAGATGEAISRMQELGITTRAELTEMGLAFDKSGALISPLDKSMGVLLTAMKTKFGGMMDAQSSTFEGMVSNLQDWLGQTGRIIGAPIFEVLKTNLGNLLTFLSSDTVMQGLTGFANMLAGGIQSAIDAVSRGVAVIQDVWGDFQDGFAEGGFFGGLANGAARLGEMLGLSADDATKLGDAIWAVGQVVQGFVGFLNGANITPFYNALEDIVGAEVASVITDIVIAAQVLFDTISSGDLSVLTGFLENVGFDSPLIQSVMTGISKVGELIGTLFTAIQTGDTGPLVAKIGELSSLLLNWISTDVIPFMGQKIGELVSAIGGWIVANVPVIVGKLAEWEGIWLNFLATKVIPFIGEKIGELVTAIGTWITANGPAIEAQITEWANLFLNWVQTSVIPFIGTKVSEIATAIGTWITTNGPTIVAKLTEWANAFLNWVGADVIPFIGAKIGEIATAVGTWITTNAPGIITKLGEWAKAFLGWVDTDVVPFLTPKLEGIWTAISTWVTTQKTNLDTKLQEWGAAFTKWITDLLPTLPAKLLEIWTTIYNWVQETASKLTQNTGKLAESITTWIREKAIPWLRTEFPKFVLVLIALIVGIPALLVATLAVVALALVNGIIDGMKKYFNEKAAELVNMGKLAIEGLVKGLEAAKDAVRDALLKILGDAIQAIKDFLGIKSPSRVMAEIGKNTGMGFVEGLLGTKALVAGAMADLGNAATFNGTASMQLSPAYAGAGAASVSAGGGPATLRLTAPIVIEMNGRRVAEATYDDLAELFYQERASEYGGVR